MRFVRWSTPKRNSIITLSLIKTKPELKYLLQAGGRWSRTNTIQQPLTRAYTNNHDISLQNRCWLNLTMNPTTNNLITDNNYETVLTATLIVVRVLYTTYLGLNWVFRCSCRLEICPRSSSATCPIIHAGFLKGGREPVIQILSSPVSLITL